MKRVAILKYGMGNIDSVARAVEECGGRPVVAEEPSQVEGATHIILPGVGSFSQGMAQIQSLGFDTRLEKDVRERGLPFLGICLGMQFLATGGCEGGETAGFGWIPGEVIRLLPAGPSERIPHIGWNNVFPVRPSPLFSGIPEDRDFYFVHSYHFHCHDERAVLATTPYCGSFVSAIQQGNIFGVQFHPEKSQKAGFRLIRNFLAMEGPHA